MNTTQYDVSGLSTQEALQRLQQNGYNELAPPHQHQLGHILLEVLQEPMFLLLIAAGFIYLLLGSVQDALMLLGFVFIIIAMTVFQAQKSAQALASLRDLSSPLAKVVRDGRVVHIPGREVVTGDLLLLTEGDRVAADSRVLSCNDLFADESMLTGESVPVAKRSGTLDLISQQTGEDDEHLVYAGTIIVQGRGVGCVIATGKESAIGKIGQSLTVAHAGISPLRIETARLVRRLAIIAIALCIILVLLYGYMRGHWLNALLAGISLAMSTLPEEFPVILSVFMSLGAWRISQYNVLARRLDAIETLGATTVLCTDKTGTLTQNHMVIKKLYSNGLMHSVHDFTDLPEPWHELLEFGILASEKEPFDPMERALHELGERTLSGSEHLHAEWEIIHEYSLSPDLLAMSHVWLARNQPHHLVAAKGAPEAIVDLCHLDDECAAKIEAAAAQLADEGLRVLGVARGKLLRDDSDWPSCQHDIDFTFVGLLGLQDPLRPGVILSIAKCHAAGIRVVMVTGDHPRTAQSIARELGLATDQVLTGADLNVLSDEELQYHLHHVQVFARIVPQQKLRLVEALKANGEIVAMTGDGVNDAPALKAAHIGVAMGVRGTDVAREAAALVLLDDDFTSLVASIRLGRRIYANLRRAMSYALSAHIPIVGLALLPVFLGAPMLLMPAHIMFLELIIGPACSVFFEAEGDEPSSMQRPPRAASETLFSGGRLATSLLQGLLALAVSIAVYGVAVRYSDDENTVRALVFTSMVSGNIALVLCNRFASETLSNPSLKWIVFGTLSGLLGVLFIPGLRTLFYFSGEPLPLILVALLVAFLVWFAGRAARRLLDTRHVADESHR